MIRYRGRKTCLEGSGLGLAGRGDGDGGSRDLVGGGDGGLDAELTFELGGDSVDFTVALAGVEELGIVNRAERVVEVTSTSEELVLGDGLVVGRLVNDGSLVGNDVGGMVV